MNKLKYYVQLENDMMIKVAKNPKNWMSFLDTASRLYRYNFSDQILIHAQRPEATACAELPLWNRLRRYIRRGSKGIALLKTDRRGDYYGMHYVFDVVDVRRGSFNPYLWKYKNEYQEVVSKSLEERFGVSCGYSLADQLERISSILAQDFVEDNKKEIFYAAEGSYLETLAEGEIESLFCLMVSVSLGYISIRRCNLKQIKNFIPDDFIGISDFNTRKIIKLLGDAISQKSESVLRHIAVTIWNFEHQSTAQSVQTHDQKPKPSMKQELFEETYPVLAVQEPEEPEEAVAEPEADTPDDSDDSETNPGVYDKDNVRTEPEAGCQELPEPVGQEPQTAGYEVGDTVCLDGTMFEITNIGMFDVELRDPSLTYPLFRVESRERFEKLLQSGSRSSEKPEPERHNFKITDYDLGAGGPKQKYHANLQAIRLLKELEGDNNRLATPEEQEILSRFVGWGGIPAAFDDKNESWSEEYAELKEILTPEEYREARASTLNAFYTPPVVIQAMYEALENLGLKRGNVLEPSCGIGNFMGLEPESMDGLKMYGVELDSISGKIAKQLYQKNTISIQGFETAEYPDSFFDCVIGNVPFGAYKVADKRYDQHNFLIHDYFIAKSLDLTRPNGVIAVVTSSGTMDKQSASVRRYIADRADLLGAIRLPNNAFQRNAGTSVIADILFFQKRDCAPLEQPYWVDLGTTSEGHTVNAYFVRHPEMVLGEFTTESTQYGKQEVTVKPIEAAVLSEQLKEAVSHIHGTITEVELEGSASEEVEASIPADPSVKNFSFADIDGKVYYRENSVMNPAKLPGTTTARILGMIKLRDLTQELGSLAT